MTSVAIIVLHFGNAQETFFCLKSLQYISSKIKHKIFVVDNGTKNITIKDLQQINPKIELISNKENLGFSEGNNSAIRKGLKENFSHYLLLNNDTMIKKDILKKLLPVFSKKSVGIVGCSIVYEKDQKRIWFNGGYINKLFAFTKHRDINKDITILSGKIKETDFITGAAMMIKKEVFERIGLLPIEYFLYWEDVDFCYAAKQNNFLIKIVEEPLVMHKVSSSAGIKGTNVLSPLRAFYYARNPFIFIKKFHRPLFLGILGQIAGFVFYITKVQNKEAAYMYIKGFLKGLALLFNENLG